MSDLVPTARGLPIRAERGASRSLERIHASQQVVTATQIAKVEVIADTTEAALIAGSHIAIIESLLADRVSAAEGQLHAIARAGTTGLALVFARTDTDWFHRAFAAATAACFIRRRLRFVSVDGRQRGSAGAPSMLLAHGLPCALALAASGLGRTCLVPGGQLR